MDEDEVEDLRAQVEWSQRTDKAEALESLAMGLATGEHGRATFLTAAAEHWILRGELGRARALLAEAATLPPEGPLAVAAVQLGIAVAAEDEAETRRLLDGLLVDFRADRVTSSTCHYVGEVLESAGDLRAAHRWLTLPLSNVDPDEELAAVEELCVEGRARVRRLLGLPVDRFDRAAQEIAAWRLEHPDG